MKLLDCLIENYVLKPIEFQNSFIVHFDNRYVEFKNMNDFYSYDFDNYLKGKKVYNYYFPKHSKAVIRLY